MKNRYVLILQCRERKIRCLERDLTCIFGFLDRRSEFKSRSRKRVFLCSLQCQINMNLGKWQHISHFISQVVRGLWTEIV